jgi:hypothetical protein
MELFIEVVFGEKDDVSRNRVDGTDLMINKYVKSV